MYFIYLKSAVRGETKKSGSLTFIRGETKKSGSLTFIRGGLGWGKKYLIHQS
jgi:hypothetical protein